MIWYDQTFVARQIFTSFNLLWEYFLSKLWRKFCPHIARKNVSLPSKSFEEKLHKYIVSCSNDANHARNGKAKDFKSEKLHDAMAMHTYKLTISPMMER